MNNEFLEVSISAVRKSGGILLDYFDKLHDAKQKNMNLRDIVTEVDLLSEKKIREIISYNYPGHLFVGEEMQNECKTANSGDIYKWYIDPIDGTVNYSQGIPLCAVSLALEINGVLSTGVIYNPLSDELFYASKGGGAFLNGKNITVSNKKNMKECLFVGAFSSKRGLAKKREYELFGEINDTTRGALRIGSAALAMAYLASARIDGFWSIDLFSWDLAAGILLVKESGGKVLSNEREYSFGDSICYAANQNIIYEFESVIKKYVG